MQTIFIKYNPYRVVTEITLNGEPAKEKSPFNVGEKRLQEWVEELPKMLYEEIGSDDYELTFYGTTEDYEDIVSVAENPANKEFGIHFNLIFKAANDTVKDKEQRIAKIFEKIQKGPFESLHGDDVRRSFETIKNQEFEMYVVATMSSGKSTLINALLGQRMLFAQSERTTAKATRIKDNSNHSFSGKAFLNTGEFLTADPFNLAVAEEWNSNENIERVHIEGNIPFVNSNEMSLVIIDTPGTNSAKNPEDAEITYKQLSEGSRNLVLYVLNASQLETNDDKDLLKEVTKSMATGGKQSKDRFLFVVNKLDNFNDEDGDSVERALENVRQYLKEFDINDPNLYPAAALPALNIRRSYLKDLDNSQARRNTLTSVQNLNELDEFHLEKYAPLPSSLKKKISAELEAGKDKLEQVNPSEDAWLDNYDTALVHTGIRSIEFAIETYLRKYAKTKKIKDLVDSFNKKLEEGRAFDILQAEIAENESVCDEMARRIPIVTKKLSQAEKAEEFNIDVKNAKKDAHTLRMKIFGKAETEIGEEIVDICDAHGEDNELSLREAKLIARDISKFFDKFKPRFSVEVGEELTGLLKNHATQVIEAYTKKIVDILDELQIDGIEVSAVSFADGEIFAMRASMNELVSNLTESKQYVSGYRMVNYTDYEDYQDKNTNKKWYKPWTWLDDEYVTRTREVQRQRQEEVYGTKQYVPLNELRDSALSDIMDAIREFGNETEKKANHGFEVIHKQFEAEKAKLSNFIQKKTDELNKITAEQKNAEIVLKETQKRKDWLEGIQAELNSILGI